MVSNEIGRDLHDRATRGMPLSSQQQAQLDEWYAQQDIRESGMLATAPSEELLKLRQEIDLGLVELQSVARRVMALAGENQTLKQDIATLVR